MKQIDWQKWAAVAVCLAVGVVAVRWAGKVIAVYLLPFLLAWLLSLAITPVADRISRRLHCSPRLCAILLLTLALCGTVWIIGASVNRLLSELQGLLSRLLERGELSAGLMGGQTDYFQAVLSRFRFLERISAPEQQAVLRDRFNQMVEEAVGDALASASAALPKLAARMISAMPSVLLFIAVTVIAGFYFCGDRKRIEQSLLSVLPASWRERIPPWRDRARQASFRYLRAYMLLLLLTFLELFVGLGLLRVDYAFLLAAVIAVVDLLPVLGVGTVLIPWAVVELFNRRFSLGVGLLILYLAVSVLHQILEPKLVGKSLGLHPLLTLAAGYIGFRSFGILGMAAAPFAALLCKCFLARACRAEDGEGERG